MYTLDALDIVNKIINDPQTLEKALLKKNAFSQKEILDFKAVIAIMLDYSNDSLQGKITRHCNEYGKKRTVTKQALSKALSHIDETPFVAIFNALIDYIYNGNHLLKTYKNYLLFAVDGSYFNIPRTLENATFFDNENKSINLKLGGSMIYDVLNNVPLDFEITDTFMNERQEFLKQLEYLITHYADVVSKAIFTFDRGYPSSELIKGLSNCKAKFVIRCSKNFLKEVNESPIGDNVITLQNGVSVRVLKFKTEKDELITLITNLYDFSIDELKEIYRLRWIVETSFNTAKNKLFVDKNQGKTVNFLKQSYWATIVKMTFLGIGQNECDRFIENEEKENKETSAKCGHDTENKYHYKTNTQILIKTFSTYFVLSGAIKTCINSVFNMVKAIREATKRRVKKTITDSVNVIYKFFEKPIKCNTFVKS
jgi:hypothetical protein